MYIILCYFLDTFTELLCQRLAKLLKEQHDSTIDPDTDQTEWLQDTAHCIEFILLSGTFRKAVNLRINNTVIPLLAELIACLDRNGNLELALHNNSVPECLSNLWHDISKDETLIVLHYQDTNLSQHSTTEKESSCVETNFTRSFSVFMDTLQDFRSTCCRNKKY